MYLFFLYISRKIPQSINTQMLLRNTKRKEKERHYMFVSLRFFFHLFHSYIDIKSKAATACNLHFLGVALNAFRVSMPRETTVPFTKKISIYPDTDGYRADAAMKSRRKKRISLCVRSPGTHFRAIHTVKGGDKSDARCCLSHLSFV